MMQTSIISKSFYQINGVDQTEYSEKVYKRLEIIEKYGLLKSECLEEETILDVLNTPRSTLFLWKRNYKKLGLIGLEDNSKRPKKTRQPKWTYEIENRIYHLRKKYPVWGKAKIRVIYEKTFNEKISESMVGRILKKLIEKGRIKPVAFICQRKTTKKREFNNYAQRWKYGMRSKKPGELVQFDHSSIYLPDIGQVKHFSAICPITKFAVNQVYKEANSKNAADFLHRCMLEFPFPIISIQCDGGGEFMKCFEDTCKKLNVPLWVLPPRSPEYNGNVERGNGTFKYEFYSQFDSSGKSFHVLQKYLQKSTSFYNNIRPHQGLNYLTPVEFISQSEILRGGGPV